MRNLLITLLLLISVSAFGQVILDHTDPMFEWEIDVHGNTEWHRYNSVRAYANAHNIPFREDRPENVSEYNMNNAILFYNDDFEVCFALQDILVDWNWKEHGHVHVDTFAGSEYQDIHFLLALGGYIDINEDGYPNLDHYNYIEFEYRFQRYINDARLAYLLDPAPIEYEPRHWNNTQFTSIEGGEWVRHAGNWYIAKIDIPQFNNVTEPDLNIAFRRQDVARYRPEYNGNDFDRTMLLNADGATSSISLDYTTHTITITLPESELTTLYFNMPRWSPISIENPYDDQEWFVGHISHSTLNRTSILFQTDPQSKKGFILNGTYVRVRIKQERD